MRSSKPNVSRLGPALLVAAAVLAGCSGEPDRVVVVGMDGLDPDILVSMLRRGELPTFQKIVDEGASANLWVPARPILSPMLWTSMASAYPGDVHGITDWAGPSGNLYDATDVKVRRVWEVASDRGDKVLVLGWLLSYPAAEVRGYVITDMLVQAVNNAVDPQGVVWPPDLHDPAIGYLPSDEEIAEHQAGYLTVSGKAGTAGRPVHFIPDAAMVAAFEDLWGRSHADLALVYLSGADRVGHNAVALGGGTPWAAPDAPDLGQWVGWYYRYLDTALARILAKIDPRDTTLFVVSDHGFEIHKNTTEEMRHRDPGLIIAWGGRTRQGVVPGTVTQYDFARTLWVASGLPLAGDQVGSVLTDWLDVQDPAPTVDTWVVGAQEERAANADATTLDEARTRELQALGYLDASGLPAGRTPPPAGSPTAAPAHGGHPPPQGPSGSPARPARQSPTRQPSGSR